MRLNVALSEPQEQLFKELIEVIKSVGEFPKSGDCEERGVGIGAGKWVNTAKREEFNKNAYKEIITLLLALKMQIMKGNFAELIKSNLSPTHVFNFFDQDEGVFKNSPLSEIEVILGEDKPLTEAEKRAIQIQLKQSVLLEEGNPLRANGPMVIDLGKYDEQIEDELEELGKTKRKVKPKENLNDPRFAAYKLTKEEEDAINNSKILQPSAAELAEYMKIIS